MKFRKLPYSQNEVLVEQSFDNVKVSIKFILRDKNDWVNKKNISSDFSLIERVIEKHIDVKRFLFNMILQFMIFFECFKIVVVDDTKIIFLILQEKIDINSELTIFASRLNNNYKNMSQIMLKRIVLNNIFEQGYVRKNYFIERSDIEVKLFTSFNIIWFYMSKNDIIFILLSFSFALRN